MQILCYVYLVFNAQSAFIGLRCSVFVSKSASKRRLLSLRLLMDLQCAIAFFMFCRFQWNCKWQSGCGTVMIALPTAFPGQEKLRKYQCRALLSHNSTHIIFVWGYFVVKRFININFVIQLFYGGIYIMHNYFWAVEISKSLDI